MRKLVESTFVTFDGVISTPQTWGPAYWDEHAASTTLTETTPFDSGIVVLTYVPKA